MIKGDQFVKLVSTLVLASVLSLAGCGGGGSNSSGNNAAPTSGSIKFINSSAAGHSIDGVYAIPAASTTWGSTLNPSPIAVGSSWTLSGLTAGPYNARVASIGISSTYYASGPNVPVVVGTTTSWTVIDSNYSGSLNITNNSGSPITALYVSPTAYGAGANQLTTNLVTGSTRQIRGIPSGVYYVEAVINGIKKDVTASIASYSYTTISY